MSHLLTNLMITNIYIKLKNEQEKNILNKLVEELCKILINKYTPENGYLYCLYKLGECADIKSRMTGYVTPYPDPCIIKCQTENLRNKYLAETILFEKLKKYRYRANREFFQCDLLIIENTFLEIEEMFANKTDEQIINDIFIKPELTRINIIININGIKFNNKFDKENNIDKNIY